MLFGWLPTVRFSVSGNIWVIWLLWLNSWWCVQSMDCEIVEMFATMLNVGGLEEANEC